MLRIIYEHDDPELMERVWAFRHKRFVEEMGWHELRRPDNRERDLYDTPVALHAVLLHEREVIGYSRLLPTTAPHLVWHLCPQPWVAPPSGPRIYEWSRCAIASTAPSIRGHAASDLLMTGVLECLVEIGACGISFVTYPPVVKMMQRRGYPVEILADLTMSNKDRVQVAFSGLPAYLLKRHRDVHGIHHTLLSWGKTYRKDRGEPSCVCAAET